jgi:long-chain acyl-CoA synthetase
VQSVADVLRLQLEQAPEREALAGRFARYTYHELDAAADRAAGALAGLGIRTGDRVAASLPNQTDIVVAFLGAMRLGAIWVGVNRTLAAPEKAYVLGDAEAALLLADPATAHEIAARSKDASPRVVTVDPGGDHDEWARLLDAAGAPPRPPVDPFAPAALAYTSGTTGFPKGAVHSQHNLLLPGAVAGHRGQYGPDDRLGVMLPLTLLNLIVLGPLVAFQVGIPCVALDRLDPPGLAASIRAERITTFATVPAVMHDLLTHPDVHDDDLTTLRAPGVGGADCPEAFRALYRERFGTEVTLGYGLTEAPTAVTMTDPGVAPVPNSSGRPLPHVQVLVVGDGGREVPPGEIGELCVAPATDGPFAGVYTPMLGYWNRAEASAEALRGGVLHTGDLGYVDDDGEVFVKDRKGDLIIRGGANVYPAEVERVLHDDPRVAACAVVGRPDPRLGERVVAFVQLAAAGRATAEELRNHCATRLARYKVPEEIRFVDDFPRTAMNKIRKGDLPL